MANCPLIDELSDFAIGLPKAYIDITRVVTNSLHPLPESRVIMMALMSGVGLMLTGRRRPTMNRKRLVAR
jgi:hypothetical protein